MGSKFVSVDTIYREDNIRKINYGKKEIGKKPIFFYFYKSFQVVLSVWIFTVLVITIQPWADYWIKSTINQKTKQTLGENTSVPVLASPSPKSDQAFFYLKNAQVDIKAPIVEGIDEAVLKNGIGHHPDSVWPSTKGNMVLAGHSSDLDANNVYNKVFISLRLVNIDDEVVISDRGKIYHYKIFKKETVAAENTSLFGPVDDWILTFYTCDPPYTDWKRLVLQAKLVRIE